MKNLYIISIYDGIHAIYLKIDKEKYIENDECIIKNVMYVCTNKITEAARFNKKEIKRILKLLIHRSADFIRNTKIYESYNEYKKHVLQFNSPFHKYVAGIKITKDEEKTFLLKELL